MQDNIVFIMTVGVTLLTITAFAGTSLFILFTALDAS